MTKDDVRRYKLLQEVKSHLEEDAKQWEALGEYLGSDLAELEAKKDRMMIKKINEVL
jgi:hypothetical protein